MRYRVFNSIKMTEGTIYKNMDRHSSSDLRYLRVTSVPFEDENNYTTVIYDAFKTEEDFLRRIPSREDSSSLAAIANWIKSHNAQVVTFNFQTSLIQKQR